MKKQKGNPFVLGERHSDYLLRENDTTDDLYERYCADPERIRSIDGQTYFRVMEWQLFRIRDQERLLVLSEVAHQVRIGDRVQDEDRRIFQVESFAMIRFLSEIPDWYLKMGPLVLTGETNQIGRYLAPVNAEKG